MHIADLVAHAHKFQNERILLIHFSARCARGASDRLHPPRLQCGGGTTLGGSLLCVLVRGVCTPPAPLQLIDARLAPLGAPWGVGVCRYKKSQIVAALDANMPLSLRNKCVPLLTGFA
jgi:hypothetical protein